MPKKILIVDDEEDLRELVRVSIEDEGFDICEAGTGAEALAKAREFKPDLMILDVMIPDKTGYEVCEELKGDPETSGIYIIFLSARGTTASAKTGKTKGGDEYMTKPFEPDELLDRVKKALKLI